MAECIRMTFMSVTGEELEGIKWNDQFRYDASG